VKLNHLRDIVTIAGCGSVHAAARQLKVTQPALTRSIRELERELGAPLFERHSKGVSLTDMGVRFIERAKAVLSELGHARDEIRQIQGGLHGRISVCLGLLPHLTLLPRALKAFRARYPDVRLDITEGQVDDARTKWGFDIGEPEVPSGDVLRLGEPRIREPKGCQFRAFVLCCSVRDVRDRKEAEDACGGMHGEPCQSRVSFQMPAPRGRKASPCIQMLSTTASLGRCQTAGLDAGAASAQPLPGVSTASRGSTELPICVSAVA
jgi:DNA-binding transcriptional LysR family regulator